MNYRGRMRVDYTDKELKELKDLEKLTFEGCLDFNADTNLGR